MNTIIIIQLYENLTKSINCCLHILFNLHYFIIITYYVTDLAGVL